MDISIFIYTGVFILCYVCFLLGTRFKIMFDPFTVLALVTLILFAGLRVNVGTDFINYVNAFAKLQNINYFAALMSSSMEGLFSLLSKFLYSVGGKELTFSFWAAIIVVPVYVTLSKRYKNFSVIVPFSIFYYSFFVSSFNGVRQYVAISLIFCAFVELLNSKYLLFFVLQIICFFIHKSSIVTLPLCLLWSNKNNKNNLIVQVVLILVVVLAIVFWKPVISFLSSSDLGYEKYASYTDYSKKTNNFEFLLNCAELVLLSAFYNKLNKLDLRNNFFLTLFVVGTALTFLGYFNPYIKRVGLYFLFPSKLILFSYLPLCFNGYKRIFMSIAINLASISLFVIKAFVFEQADLVPYSCILFN